MPNGKTTVYGVVESADCVGILPFLDEEPCADGAAISLRVRGKPTLGDANWRSQARRNTVDAAHRQFREEVGYDAGRLSYFNTYYTSKSVFHEIAHLYIGRNIIRYQGVPDASESLEIDVFPFRSIIQMVLESEIRDSMTILAVLLAARQLGR